ncbi:MAG: hypothetical protein O3A49_06875 [Candidatus Marinimicrobia bacterium]|nr:hypothetical protein [Candidatus Neomarinimicrobiota bacterium]
MKHLLLILIFFITSCSPPEPLTDAWFKQKHKELLETEPDVDISLKKFKQTFLSQLSEEASDKKIMEKHSIGFWLMDDSLLPSSDDSMTEAQTYIRTLKLCSANFAVMHANMEAGLMYGKTITDLDDVDEISRLSDEYKNHAYYFGTRAMEIDFNVTNEEDYTAINEEIWLIQDEINKIHSNEKFLELLDSNAEICIMVRNQNPNNKSYVID